MNNGQIFKKDPTNGDHSLSMWLKMQWKWKNIQYFIIFGTLAVVEIIKIHWVIAQVINTFEEDGSASGIFVIPFVFIPPVGSLIIIYKGFFQQWRDYISGGSR